MADPKKPAGPQKSGLANALMPSFMQKIEQTLFSTNAKIKEREKAKK